MPLETATVYEFGPFRLEPALRQLRRDGTVVPLTPKAFDTLRVLVGSAGRVLSKDELLEKVWPDTTVADATLAQNIFAVRRALGESECIETVSKFGYRFVTPVHAVHAPVQSLVVLPLENLSKDPAQEYFADGLTEALIARIAQLHGLRIISRTSAMRYKGTRKSIPEIARELNVDVVAEGSVVCDGDRIRVTVQLIDPTTDASVWTRHYEHHLRDVLMLQTEVAEAITTEILGAVMPPLPHANKRRQVDTEAYQNYLRGRFSWNKRNEEGVRKAIDYFHAAIERDPTYALAYTGLADAYALLGDWGIGAVSPREAFALSRAAVLKALALEPDLGEAHTSLAHLHFHALEWEKADAEWRRAIELSPGHATARHWYAYLLSARGRHEEAFAQISQALMIDPLSVPIQSDIGELAYFARQDEVAVAEIRKALDMDPRFERAHRVLGHIALDHDRFEEAMAAFGVAVDVSCRGTEALAALGRGYARAGDTAALKNILTELSAKPYVSPYTLATIHAAGGRRDEALSLLHEACEQGVAALPFIGVDPRLATLHGDRRFDDLLRRIGVR
jgi:TolB-like protein/Tfp pilus assembly protein PilF